MIHGPRARCDRHQINTLFSLCSPAVNQIPVDRGNMGKLTRITLAVLFAAMILAPGLRPARAGSLDTPPDPLHFFADCLGRATAERLHREILGDMEAADRAHHIVERLSELVDLMTPEDQGSVVRQWRAQARAAHSSLLNRADYRSDPWAADRAAQFLRHCTALLLPVSADAA